MASDLQVIFPQDMIPLSGVVELPRVDDVRAIVIDGRDFRTVEEVLINDVRSPSLYVESTTRLVAIVPPSLFDDAITNVSVFSNVITISRSSRIRFKLGDSTTRVSGMLRLMQTFLKVLVTTPGRDIFSPQLGGDALRAIGHTIGREQGTSVAADFVIAVDRTAKQLIALQAGDNRLARDERLLKAVVEAASFSVEASALIVTVALYNQAGKIGLANVAV